MLSLPSSSSPLSFSLSLSLGTLRSDNGDVYENIVEKRLRILNFFVIILSRPGTEKKGIYVAAEERGPRQSSDKDAIIYSLPFPFSSESKIGHFTSYLCRNDKEMYKKS